MDIHCHENLLLNLRLGGFFDTCKMKCMHWHFPESEMLPVCWFKTQLCQWSRWNQ